MFNQNKKNNALELDTPIPDVNKVLLDKVKGLLSLIEQYEFYKSYDTTLAELKAEHEKAGKAYHRLRTKKRLTRYLRARTAVDKLKYRFDNTNIEDIKERLKSYEGFIDKKYWHYYTLFLIKCSIEDGTVRSIEELRQRLVERGEF